MPSEDVKNLSSLDAGNDKKCQNLDAEQSKTLPILRKDNVKRYPCPWCGTPYPSRQALHYHLHNSQTECREKQETAEQDPAAHPDQKKTFPDVAPAATGDYSEPTEGSEHLEKLDGDTPPIPLALLVIIIFVLAVLGLIVFFWDSLYKFARKHLGGEAVGSLPE